MSRRDDEAPTHSGGAVSLAGDPAGAVSPQATTAPAGTRSAGPPRWCASNPQRRGRRRRRPAGRALAAGALLGAAVFAGTHLQGQPARADAGGDSDLFSLTNQDRTSNGVAALADNSTLSAIGEAAPYSGCSGAGTIDGRAQDMINRNYFAHQIPPCNQYVWSMMSAFGVRYQSAGENIGWGSGYDVSGSAGATWINTQFMNSSDHRANILNPNYTALGIGSAYAASGWNGGSGGTGPEGLDVRRGVRPAAGSSATAADPFVGPELDVSDPDGAGHRRGHAGTDARPHPDPDPHPTPTPTAGPHPHSAPRAGAPAPRLRVQRPGPDLRHHRGDPRGLPLLLELRTMPPHTAEPAP